MLRPNGPKWWWLYLGMSVFLILFAAEIKLPLSETGHRVVEVVIILAAFGLTHWWLNANASELLYRSRRKSRTSRVRQSHK